MSRCRLRRAVWSALVCFLLPVAPAIAVQTQVLTQESFADFSAGQLLSTQLSSRGQISRAPARKKRCEINANLIFDIAADGKGGAFVATGDLGYVFHVSKNDVVTTVTKLPEPLVTALAFDPDGAVYAAGAPGGRIYRIQRGDNPSSPTLFCDTKEKYVWSMLLKDDAGLIAGTGSDGKIVTISRKGRAEVLLDTDTKNVMALLMTADKRLLALTHDKARIYEIEKKDSARVLYEGKLDEGRAMVEDAHGNILIALNDRRTAVSFVPPAAPSMQPIPSVSALSPPSPPEPPTPPRPTPTPAPSPSPAPVSPQAPSRPEAGGTGVVVKVDRLGFATLLWTATEAPIQSMILDSDGESLLVGAGSKGKLFRVQPNGDYAIVFSVDESTVLSLERASKGFFFGTADLAAFYRVSDVPDEESVYVSAAVDAGSPVRWGQLVWRGVTDAGSALTIDTRTGSTVEPNDALWAPWSEPRSAQKGSIAIQNPIGRYLQYRITFPAKAAAATAVEKVELYYIPQNLAPVIKSVKIKPAAAKLSPIKLPAKVEKTPAPGSNPSASRLVSASSGPSKPATPESHDTFVAPFSNPQKKIISWEVSDPNNDTTEADAYFRAEDETTWKLIQEKAPEGELEFDTRTVPDGEYRVKIVVQDSPSNPHNSSLQSQLVSNRFVIDNTEPIIKGLISRHDKTGTYTIHFTAADALSLLADAQFSIDAGDWEKLAPDDRLMDSSTEAFTMRTEILQNGEHTLAILLTDAEGNTVVKKSILTR